jgi:EpsD family peptidyl-prolyl cis-trans isomerase
MNKVTRISLVAAAAALALSACHGKGKEPTGQVVATVDGEEITLREVNAELTGFNFPDEKNRKAAQQQALRAVLNRHILAKAARDRGLDKTPDYAVLKERADQVTLAQQLEATISKAVPTTSREEAQRYVQDHPNLFSERKIMMVDQLRVRGGLDPKISEQMKPMTSLDQVAALFTQNNIQFVRGSDRLDAVGSDPKFIDQVVKLKSTDMFTVPVGGFTIVNQVRETKVEPFTGDQAINYATQLLTKQHTQEAVLREYQSILQKAQDKIQYAKDFKPAPAPAAPGANAPATNAAQPK